MIYLALVVAVCVAAWEAIQLVKTRRQLAAEREALRHVTSLYNDDCRVIADALRGGASVVKMDDDPIGGTD